MNRLSALVILAVVGVVVAYPTNELQGNNEDDSNTLAAASWDVAVTPRRTMVSRAQWGARAPRNTIFLRMPVPNVIIHHTVTGTCNDRESCSRIMRSMQNHHMDSENYDDIGYNFAVGGNGEIYEGTGFNYMGSHVQGWNVNSIGIAFIGNFISNSPTQAQIDGARFVINLGVAGNFISRNHRLTGHTDVGSTACPGATLHRIIQGWPNFSF